MSATADPIPRLPEAAANELRALQQEIAGLTRSIGRRLDLDRTRAARAVGTVLIVAAVLLAGNLRISFRVAGGAPVGLASPLSLAADLVVAAVLGTVGVLLLVSPGLPWRIGALVWRGAPVESGATDSQPHLRVGETAEPKLATGAALGELERGLREIDRLATLFVVLVVILAIGLGAFAASLAGALLSPPGSTLASRLVASAASDLIFLAILGISIALGIWWLSRVWRLGERFNRLRVALARVEGEVWQRY